jgi:hypothetical protein
MWAHHFDIKEVMRDNESFEIILKSKFLEISRD